MRTDRIRTGEVVTLKPVSEHATDRVRHHDSKWVVNAISESVLFDERKGTWLGLAAKSGHENGFRWVLLEGDDNFIVERNDRFCSK
jgi:hypothetical protein